VNMPTEESTIGQRIAELRLERDLSQEELARAVGCSVTTISRLENGKNDPLDRTLRRVARALGVPPSRLRP